MLCVLVAFGLRFGQAGPAGPKCTAKGFQTHTSLYNLEFAYSRSVLPRDLFKVLPARPVRKHFGWVPQAIPFRGIQTREVIECDVFVGPVGLHFGPAGPAGSKCKAKAFRTHTML